MNIKFYIGRKKRYRLQREQNRYFGMQIMTAKSTTTQTLYIFVVLIGVIFRQILYDTVPYAQHFLPVSGTEFDHFWN